MTRKSLLCEPRAVQALSACACTMARTDERRQRSRFDAEFAEFEASRPPPARPPRHSA